MNNQSSVNNANNATNVEVLDENIAPTNNFNSFVKPPESFCHLICGSTDVNQISKGTPHSAVPLLSSVSYASLLFASSASVANPAGSFTAMSARTFLFSSTPASFRPYINLL